MLPIFSSSNCGDALMSVCWVWLKIKFKLSVVLFSVGAGLVFLSESHRQMICFAQQPLCSTLITAGIPQRLRLIEAV